MLGRESERDGTMVESVDTADLKFAARKSIRVRLPVVPKTGALSWRTVSAVTPRSTPLTSHGIATDTTFSGPIALRCMSDPR